MYETKSEGMTGLRSLATDTHVRVTYYVHGPCGIHPEFGDENKSVVTFDKTIKSMKLINVSKTHIYISIIKDARPGVAECCLVNNRLRRRRAADVQPIVTTHSRSPRSASSCRRRSRQPAACVCVSSPRSLAATQSAVSELTLLTLVSPQRQFTLHIKGT